MGELGAALSRALALANRPRSLRQRIDAMAQAEREEHRRRAPALRAGVASIPAVSRPAAIVASPRSAADLRMDRETAELKAWAAARRAGRTHASVAPAKPPQRYSR